MSPENTPPNAPAARRGQASSAQKGIACMIAGGFLLTCQDAVAKWLTVDYSNGEIMFWRGLMSVPVLTILVWRSGGLGILRTNNPGSLLVRSVLAAVTSILVVASFRHLPLAEALAIIFVSPILLTALAVPLLGERVGPRRWIAVGVGFLGVLLIVQPTGQILTWVILIPITTAFSSALRDVVTRKLGPTDSAASILFYSMVLSTLIGLIDMPRGLAVPAVEDLMIMFLAAAFWATAHFLQIQALVYAEASLISPLRYFSLVWAAILGFFIWDDVPNVWLVLGATLVVASGIYILRREQRFNGQKGFDGQI